MEAAARVPQRGDVVDIDAESDRGRAHQTSIASRRAISARRRCW
jgi:hypothetical protein